MPMSEGSSIAYAQETLKAVFNHKASSHYIRLSGTAPFLVSALGAVIETDHGMDVRGQNT